MPKVKRAIELGWKSPEINQRARKHFYFYLEGSVKLEVHWFRGEPGYTVGNMTTTNVFRALELVEDASRCREVA
jgi:hypothetical protein